MEIRHNDGSFATGQAAKIIISEIEKEFKNKSIDSLEDIISQLNIYNNLVQKHVNNAASEPTEILWAACYNMVFSSEVSKKIRFLLEKIGNNLNYYDPDSSYQEDVLAFANALSTKMQLINQLNK